MPSSTPFGTTTNGTAVQLFTLVGAGGARATITNYGGTLTSLQVPDRHGRLGHVVLGFDDVSGYQSPAFRQAMPYFGALVGRFGNRIARGRFTLDGRTYQLYLNNGPHSLHGGAHGFDQRVWQAEPGTTPEGPTLTLTYRSPDGEEGYPGNLLVTVGYTLTAANELLIAYEATTDQPTVLNLTNHTYFNLSLGTSPTVLAHELLLAADRYTVVDDTLIPTGELRPVAGTPFDFTTAHPIGQRMGQVPGGYDHNWVLRPPAGLHPAATAYDPASGRTLVVSTDQPGVQFYVGNFLDGSLVGRGGVAYGKHAGFCLETQHFPDSPNQPGFPSTVLRPGETFRSRSRYAFGVRP